MVHTIGRPLLLCLSIYFGVLQTPLLDFSKEVEDRRGQTSGRGIGGCDIGLEREQPPRLALKLTLAAVDQA